MKKNLYSTRNLAAVSVCALALAAVAPVKAANDTWTGGGAPDGNWANAANWGGVTPAAGDFLDFTTGTQLLATNNIAAGTVFNNILFDAGAGSFLLSGNPLVLTNGADAGGGNTTGGSITNFSANLETNLVPITLSAGRHGMANLGTGKLYLNAAFTRNAGAVVVFTNNGLGINLAGGFSTNGQNNIIGGWAMLSNDWATVDANTNLVPYTGYVAMSSGAIANNAAANIKFVNDSADLTAANGTVVNSIIGQNGVNRNVTISSGGTMKLGSRGGIYRNAAAGGTLTVKASSGSAFLTASGGGEITLSDGPFGATSGNLTVSALITNDAANVVTVNVMGYVTLSGNNGYTGGAYIDQGRVSANTLSAFGTGAVTVYPGAEAFLNATGNFTNNFFINGIGATETSGGQTLGAIRYGSTATNIGIITLMGNARIAGASGGNNTLLGKITGPGRLEFTAATGNNSSINLGAGSGVNDWAGGLQITDAGSSGRQVYLKLAASEEIPDGPGKGDVTLNCTTDVGRFDLNGFNETINGLNSAFNANDQVQNNGPGPSTLTLGNNNATGTFGGVISDNGNGLTIVKIGSGTETFLGANTYNGNTIVAAGTLVLSNTATLNSPNIVVSNATFDVSGESGAFNLGGAVSLYNSANLMVSMNAQPTISSLDITNAAITTAIPLNPITNIVVNTLAADGAANTVNISALPGITAYPQPFALISYVNNTGNVGTFVLGSMPSTYTGFISNDAVNSIIWLVATNGPVAKDVVWNGNVNGNWDTTTLNWISGGNAANFNQGDFVTFDDTLTGTPNVNLTTALAPFSLEVNNSTTSYVFNGPGRITGNTGLNKQGTGSLLLDNAGNSDFSGASQIAAGTVQVGSNDANGSTGTGSLTNNGALVFDRIDNYTNVNAISGAGSITQNGSGTLALNGNNSAFTGPITVSAGFLKAGTSAALGTGNVATINNGATLDVNGQILTNQTVVVSGTGVGGVGAIVSSNTAVAQLNALTNITMTGNTTIGGAGRWDVRGGAAGVNMQNFTLTKIGTNQVGFVSAVITNVNIVISQGTLDLETATATLPNSGLITVNSGANLGLFANPANTFLCPIALNGGAIRTLGGGISAVDAPVTLTGNSFLDSGAANPGTVINGAIGQSGGSFGLTKLSAGAFYLGAANTYSGPTIVAAGALALTNSGSIAATAYISVSNATLDVTTIGYNSTICTNSVMLTSNANLLVAGSQQPFIGGLGMTNSTVRLVSAQVSVPSIIATNLAFGPQTNFLNIVSFSSTPSANQFPVIQYATLTGTFNLGLSGVPANFGGYLSNNVANHTIDLVLTASVATVNWTGNDSAVDSYWSDGVNWNGSVPLQNNLLDFSGSAGLINTNNLAANTAFGGITFDNGSYVLNGNPLAIAAGGAIQNNTANSEIVNMPVSTSGTNLTLSGNSGGLTMGGGITNTAAAQEFLTLNGTGIISNSLATPAGGALVFLSTDGSANWTILDNASASPMTVSNGGFNINGGGTLNFGSANSAPNLTFTGAWQNDNGVGNGSGTTTFNMINGTLSLPARINTQGNPGGNINVSGGALSVANQIQLANGSSSDTSTLTVSGGTFTINGGTGTLYIASRGTGTVNMNGGALNCGRLDLSRNASGNTAGSVGVFNLNGGVVKVSSVSTLSANSQSGGNPTATMNFNGGILKASASSANFFQRNNQGAVATPDTPINSYVQAGGAIIDDGGFAITIEEPFQHDSNLGGTPDGGLLKLGAGTLTLTTNNNSYTGNTVISNGTLLVNGALGQTFVRVANGTLGGTGSVGSNVTVSVNGNIAPATIGVIGTLTIVSNLVLQGNTSVDINHTVATCDQLVANSVTYGGTLTVTNLSGTLSTNDTFKVFTAASYSGAFSSISPAAPAPGMGWNTNTLTTDGTLRLVATVNLAPTNVTATVNGNLLTLTWPADHTGWSLQVQTNGLGNGLGTNWVTVPGANSVNTETFTINPVNGTVFYRLSYP